MIHPNIILTNMKGVKKYMDIMNKQALLDFIDNPVIIEGHNIMRCNENWYNPLYSISQVFTKEEIEAMNETEVGNLLKLANEISEALY